METRESQDKSKQARRHLVLVAFCLSGAAALIYEVVWTRELALVLGSTTYALSTILSTFMAGLALGAYLGGRLADRPGINLLGAFGLMELGIGAFGLLTVPAINALSPFYLSMYNAFHLSPTSYFIMQFVVCVLIMLVPTTLMGATFPVVSRIVTERMDEMGRSVGNVYSFNTMGAIVGSFSAGFILIPLAGVRAATLTAAVLNVLVAMTVLVLSRIKIKTLLIILALGAVSSAAALSLASGGAHFIPNYYMASRFPDYETFEKETKDFKILYDKDHREGRVRLWRDNMGFFIIQVGGKIEGTALSDLANTYLLAYLPVAAHPDPQSALVIGLGAGVTLREAKKYVPEVALVEINAGVVEAIDKFGFRGLMDGVDVVINDARNYLLLTDRKFDIISSEPSYPTETSTANLFTREFYEIAAERLNPGGMFAQWLPYYQLSNDDVTMMLRTFGTVFEHVYLWKVEDSLDLIMVGSNSPFIYGPEELKSKTRALNKDEVILRFKLSRRPAEIDAIVRDMTDIPLNTDDRPILEFHAARNLITGVKD